MKVINIADERQRNARVSMEHKRAPQRHHYVDRKNTDVYSIRIVKNTIQTDLKALTQTCSREELSQQLIDGDPELDLELFGKRVHETSRIYLNENNQPASAVQTKELFFTPEGEFKEQREQLDVEPNINTDAALSWSGKLIPKSECYKKFVFVNAFQIRHIDGLTYDFLYSMAKNLEDKNSLMLLGAGAKSNQPLILSRNGKPYRSFLEGRIDGTKYMLIMHLSEMELKALPKSEDEG